MFCNLNTYLFMSILSVRQNPSSFSYLTSIPDGSHDFEYYFINYRSPRQFAYYLHQTLNPFAIVSSRIQRSFLVARNLNPRVLHFGTKIPEKPMNFPRFKATCKSTICKSRIKLNRTEIDRQTKKAASRRTAGCDSLRCSYSRLLQEALKELCCGSRFS